MDTHIAVKAVLQDPSGKFLIVRQGARWQAVGGRLKAGEHVEDGLRREVFEETGLTEMTIDRIIHVDEWDAKPQGVPMHIIALFFLCHTTETHVTLSDEHEEYRWIAVDELDSLGDAVEKEIKKAILIASM
jgi:8-oxo-dGTP pyrophosphatase MutT (NUDIX family)